MHTIKQVYAQLNHLSLSLSYTGTIQVVQHLSELQKIPLIDWLKEGAPVKYISDNVNKQKKVRDIRSDHQSKMHNMYSVLVTKGRVSLPGSDVEATCTSPCQLDKLKSIPPATFLPSKEDVLALRGSLKVLVARILCKYITCLAPLSKQVPQHVSHENMESMALKSEVFFVDVLMKNEAVHADMVDIMEYMQDRLGEEFSTCKVLSGGDQLTCERQANAQRHRMDGDSTRDRLQLLEPMCEDWHALMCFMKVTYCMLEIIIICIT